MKPGEINWRSGEVIFWDLGFLEQGRSIQEQVEDLKEDLAQVAYRNEVLLDVGWYPEFSVDGGFVVQVVRGSNWDVPLFCDRCTSVEAFLKALDRAAEYADANSRRSEA